MDNIEFRQEPNTIAFMPKDTAVLTLDAEGFVYKGTRIDDAGTAYNLFIQVMQEIKHS